MMTRYMIGYMYVLNVIYKHCETPSKVVLTEYCLAYIACVACVLLNSGTNSPSNLKYWLRKLQELLFLETYYY